MSSLDFDSKTIKMEVKKEVSSNKESGMEFISAVRPTQTTSIYHLVPDSEIKHEVVNLHLNPTTNADPAVNFDQDLTIMSNVPYPDFDCSSVKTVEKDLNDTYLDLLQCQRDCETCQRFLNLLSVHIRSTHCPSQPTQDPLHINPFNVDTEVPPTEQSLSVQIKCEGDDNIDEVGCSQEEDLKFESEIESEIVPDYTPSPHLTPNIIPRRLTKDKPCTDCKCCKAKKRNPSSQHQFKCDECDKGFSRKVYLTLHKRIHTGKRPYKCDLCEKSFVQKSTLTVHKRSHTGERPYQCDVCEKSFSSSTHLTRHKRIHTGHKPYKCEECGNSFTLKSHLSTHKRIHTGQKPLKSYKCTVCENNFTSLTNLTEHMRTHTGEWPYECTVCKKRFTSFSDLNTHRRIHTEVMPYHASNVKRVSYGRVICRRTR